MKTKLAILRLCIPALQSLASRPTASRFFKTSDGVRIHYLESGSGRPIVFIPGWAMPGSIWQKQMDAFSK